MPRTGDSRSWELLRIALTSLAALTCPMHGASPSRIVDLQGNAANPLQTHEKVTVLVYLRTDCPISNRYAPVIQELSRRYAGSANFWLVYPSASQMPSAIAKQISDFHYELPVARDLAGDLVKEGHAATAPSVAVFGRAEKLIYTGRIDNWYEDFGRVRAAPTTHELDDAIQAGIAGKAARVSSAPAVGCSLADLQ